MTSLPFLQVDAFADAAFTGNPAAVMPLDAWLPDDVLQAIAAENNLAETAFTVPAEGDADYELRWFTPTCEVEMCGHATLASGHALLGEGQEIIRFRTRKAGLLSVARDGARYALSLPVWRPAPKPLDAIVAALVVDPATVVETLWHERRYGVVVLADEAAVRACVPDMRALAAPGDWLTVVTAPGETAEVVSRAFAPGGGIDEDPVTGSAHAVIAPYWAERLGRTRFKAYQASRRGGFLDVTLDGERVTLGGSCVTVIEGRFRL
ncbi:PhzF family phenazine biosynthesis protein [Sphingomonas nostoxanthinifaciens]|uniref:PhzF family phenazine biosynthesis protein n=1 Tax=Sphingomonas nostoxanthinifaciens TaxID=2872652 RepID=UPI001CC1F5A5|nr:PhzF family phenazine biosynthesis protein [Sphingomonas nostoxanthinifaciens]UAK24872.1 PhzF family phenazine biosynthesis protein [Sphingomonas nostoxanthinifaciens]